MRGKSPRSSPSQPASGRLEALRRWLPLAVLLLGAVAFFVSGAYRYVNFETLREHREALLAWVKNTGVLAVLAFMLTYMAAVAFSLPLGTVMTLAAGFLFGTVAGTIYVVIAATLG